MHTHSETIYLNFPATDGYPLAGTLHEPRTPPVAAVLISAATGAPQRYYAAYARYLAQQGFLVLTYDYRGIGGSRWPAIRDGAAQRMRHWGERDMAGALQLLAERYPGLPRLAVGHSVGGQLLGLASNNYLVSAQLGIAAQSGYWRNWPLRLQAFSGAYWHLIVPATLAVFGKLPEWLMGYEIPAGIGREWARWCRDPSFIVDEAGAAIREHFASYRGRMRFYAIADDQTWAPASAVSALAGFYVNADKDLRWMKPSDHGMKQIGHFGFFRSGAAVSLWRETAEWLREAAQPRLRKAA